MKITRTREVKVNMGNYESFMTGATVEVDVQGNQLESDYREAFQMAEELLTMALAHDIKEASEVTLTKDSYILTMEL